MGEKVTQTLQFEVWNISDQAAMFECLKELVEHGYRGQIRCEAINGLPIWDLEVNGADTQVAVSAAFGQTVVLFGGVLESMSPEGYASRFG